MNPTPGNENYLWIPELSDSVGPGLDSMISYIQIKYATSTALQNAITSTTNNIQTETNNLEITNQGNLNVNKELYYNTTHTDYTFQRNNTIHKYNNRRSFTTQPNYFTYQRQGKQELQIQSLNNIVADLQNQINTFTFACTDPNEPIIVIIQMNSSSLFLYDFNNYYIYKYVEVNICIYQGTENPRPKHKHGI